MKIVTSNFLPGPRGVQQQCHYIYICYLSLVIGASDLVALVVLPSLRLSSSKWLTVMGVSGISFRRSSMAL